MLGDESGTDWLKVVGDLQSTVSDLQSLNQQLQVVSQEVLGQRKGQWEESQGCVGVVSDLVGQMEELDHMHAYLTWISHINTLR